MAFWSDPTLEPKRSFDWLLYINGIELFVFKSSGKPKMKIEEAKHSFLNHEYKFPGRVIWEDIEIELVDPVAPDSSNILMNIMKASGYISPQELSVNLTQPTVISKALAVAAIGDVKIAQLAADGTSAGTWSLKNAWMSDIDFGALDSSKSDLVGLKITMKFDWAEYGEFK
jgi:hypothetical protein